MATAIRITCFTMEARDRRRYGISIITSEALASMVPLFLPAEAAAFSESCLQHREP